MSLLQGSFANETYNFKEPTNRSHPIDAIAENGSTVDLLDPRGGGLGSRPKKMYGERLGMGSSTI